MSERPDLERKTPLDHLIWFCLHNKLLVSLFAAAMLFWGFAVAPFDWDLFDLPRDPVPVDAIPDLGENQQIVFTEWMGRSPQDVEDQVTYPLTTALLGIVGVKAVRSFSFFGFSTVYVIFDESIDFYWSRSRILEKLNALPGGGLPDGAKPSLGPDATALGQVFWYTLEGRDREGNPTGGWDLHELRSVQDWYVRYGLMSADGVSEVASVGGFVQEYHVDVDPDAMRAHGVTLHQVFDAVRKANIDVGARNIEINNVEYFIRGLGFVRSVEDLEYAVITMTDHVPLYIKDVAHVTLGPAQRRGILDREGAETVGGVVAVRYGENPLRVIDNIKAKIEKLNPGFPRKVLQDGTVSQVTIVPFYDRSGLIHETLGTLFTALSHEILVTVLVVLIMLLHFRSSLLISALLPTAVLMTFIAMKKFGVDANIVALSGIAIAIGTMVDMGVVIVENIVRHQQRAKPDTPWVQIVFQGTREVGSAVLTAVATTVVSFLPVFTMQAAEGKLFRPLAFTKTFALIASIVVALTLLPPLARVLLRERTPQSRMVWLMKCLALVCVTVLAFELGGFPGLLTLVWAGLALTQPLFPEGWQPRVTWISNGWLALIVAVLLTQTWMPLGPGKGFALNLVFVLLLIGGVLACFLVFRQAFPIILRWSLAHRWWFFSMPVGLVGLGLVIWLGFDRLFGWLPGPMQQWAPISAMGRAFPGLGKEFMPPLDEGSFLYMPTTSVHASIDEVADVMRIQDQRLHAIPEVETAVGKLGRAETPLDPAPISMIETVINLKTEFLMDETGRRLRFRHDATESDLVRNRTGTPLLAPDGEPYRAQGTFQRDDMGNLIPDEGGVPFRQWRSELDPDLNPGRQAWSGIRSTEDIWDEIVEAAKVPGTTSAPELQPIAARIVMLQSGMRAPMGIKVLGQDLKTLEQVGLELEKLLKKVPSVKASAVVADRIIGKPYLEIVVDRLALARYGIQVADLQQVVEVAIGGKPITYTVEGRERYAVRVRYMRELRGDPQSLERVLVPTDDGQHIPLAQVADIQFRAGPQVIKSENTFLASYVIFDKQVGYAEVDVVNQVKAFLASRMEAGEFEMPKGVSFEFAGSYQNQERASKTLMVVLPLSLLAILLILYYQFHRWSTTLFVFTGVAVAWAGGFLLIWCYGQPWFLDFHVFGISMRDLFQVHTIHLSVAVWVGFLALFGIATDDGVIIATYLDQVFDRTRPESPEQIREAVIEAASMRIRPALMTVATTVIALIPVLTSRGRGSDIMVPMAIPTFGGMLIALITVFVVPNLYGLWQELLWRKARQ